MLNDYLCPILTNSAQLKLDLGYLNINITPPTQTCIFSTHSSKLGQAQVNCWSLSSIWSSTSSPVGGGRTKMKLMLYSTQVEVQFEVRVELSDKIYTILHMCIFSHFHV